MGRVIYCTIKIQKLSRKDEDGDREKTMILKGFEDCEFEEVSE